MLSGPALFFGFSLPTTLLINSGVICANMKSPLILGPRYSEKCFEDCGIVEASSGPILAKNSLNPAAISAVPVIVFPPCLKYSGIFSRCFLVPITSLIVDHVLY